MKCPKCGCLVPDNNESWMPWGTWVRVEAFSKARPEFPILSASSGRMEEHNRGNQATEQEINHKNPGGLQLSIRGRVEEIIKNGEGRSEETGPSPSTSIESKKRAGRKKKSLSSLEAIRLLLKEE